MNKSRMRKLVGANCRHFCVAVGTVFDEYAGSNFLPPPIEFLSFLPLVFLLTPTGTGGAIGPVNVNASRVLVVVPLQSSIGGFS